MRNHFKNKDFTFSNSSNRKNYNNVRRKFNCIKMYNNRKPLKPKNISVICIIG